MRGASRQLIGKSLCGLSRHILDAVGIQASALCRVFELVTRCRHRIFDLIDPRVDRVRGRITEGPQRILLRSRGWEKRSDRRTYGDPKGWQRQMAAL